jgi:hypothetical protein
MRGRSPATPFVMAGLGPAIHAFLAAGAGARVKIRTYAQRSALHRKTHRPAQAKSWMPGPSPGMTKGWCRSARNHAQRATTTGVPTFTRVKRWAMSSLYMRMQPYEANVPIEPGRFVPWMA